jgi:hypothetical protein
MHPNVKSGAAVQLRLKGETFALIENWRRGQTKIPSRAEAIRQLVEQALGVADRDQDDSAGARRACAS